VYYRMYRLFVFAGCGDEEAWASSMIDQGLTLGGDFEISIPSKHGNIQD